MSHLDAYHTPSKPTEFEFEVLKGDNTANYPERARQLVTQYIDGLTGGEVVFETYVVMYAKVLTGWKALVSTTLPDGRYYEVTYDGPKRQTYLDPYGKLDNIVIPD